MYKKGRIESKVKNKEGGSGNGRETSVGLRKGLILIQGPCVIITLSITNRVAHLSLERGNGPMLNPSGAGGWVLSAAPPPNSVTAA